MPFYPSSSSSRYSILSRFPYPSAANSGRSRSKEVSEGCRALPAHRLLTLRYEDFFADPKSQLDIIAAFLGQDYIDEDWSARCAATVRKPRSTWRDLPADEAHALTEACRPGFELLAAAGVHYDV